MPGGNYPRAKENKIIMDQFRSFSVYEEKYTDELDFIKEDSFKEEISVDEADCSVASMNDSGLSKQRYLLFNYTILSYWI